jgi:hypothetical protein
MVAMGAAAAMTDRSFCRLVTFDTHDSHHHDRKKLHDGKTFRVAGSPKQERKIRPHRVDVGVRFPHKRGVR